MRFDIETLRELAGDTVFARGKTYHRNNQVEILLIDERRVLAQVEGTDDYRTELTGQGTDIDGQCSCPAFDHQDVCKHMVAVALAANEAGEAGATGKGLQGIRDYLHGKGVDALVDMIVDLAERDRGLLRKLEMAATMAASDSKAVGAVVRKAITDATQVRTFIDYRRAPAWAAQVDAALDTLASLIPAGHAAAALALAEHAIGRVERAIEMIDDSDGYCSRLIYRAREIHVEAARAAPPDPIKLARSLFEREMADQYGLFESAVASYVDSLGETGLAEYRRLAGEAWDKLPALMGKSPKQDHADGDYRVLAAMLDFFAERDGDIEARIALRCKDLSSSYQYLQLAQFCDSMGRAAEALRYAQEGSWIFEDERSDSRLSSFTANLLMKAGRREEAEQILWQSFQSNPNFQSYLRFKEVAGEAGRTRALALLDQRLKDTPRRDWFFDTPVGLLATILTHERMFDEAWAVVGRYGASSGIKEALAKATETSHPREATGVYEEEVERLVRAMSNDAYKSAFALVQRLARLREGAEQAAYVAKLKERHQRKRNFMKLLE